MSLPSGESHLTFIYLIVFFLVTGVLVSQCDFGFPDISCGPSTSIEDVEKEFEMTLESRHPGAAIRKVRCEVDGDEWECKADVNGIFTKYECDVDRKGYIDCQPDR